MIQAANGDIETAQSGVIYLDECDKVKTSGSGFKDMRLGVQHAHVKMIEGTVATVPPEGGYKHPAQPGNSIDTTNVLFICGGAFIGLEEIIAKRLGRGGVGFDQLSENYQVTTDGLLRLVKPEDLETFQLIPDYRASADDCPAGCLGSERPRSDSSDSDEFIDPAVQKAGQIRRCGFDVYGCGDQGDWQDCS